MRSLYEGFTISGQSCYSPLLLTLAASDLHNATVVSLPLSPFPIYSPSMTRVPSERSISVVIRACSRKLAAACRASSLRG